MRRALSSPWTITIVGTAVGTVLAAWLLGFHWSYLAPAWNALVDTAVYLSGTAQVPRWMLLALLVVLLALIVAFSWPHRKVIEASVLQMSPIGARMGPPPTFDPESFELTPVRCRAVLALRRRMEQRTTLHQLHELVTVDGEWFDADTSNAQIQHDMEDAKRAGIVTIDRVAGGDARYYSLTVPDGRDWVLENEEHLKGAQHLGMKKKPAGPRYF